MSHSISSGNFIVNTLNYQRHCLMAMVYGKPAITNQFILLKPDKNLSNHNFFFSLSTFNSDAIESR